MNGGINQSFPKLSVPNAGTFLVKLKPFVLSLSKDKQISTLFTLFPCSWFDPSSGSGLHHERGNSKVYWYLERLFSL